LVSLAAVAPGIVPATSFAQKQATVAPARDSWFGPDKVKHFFVAAFVESVAFAGLEALGTDRNTAIPAAISASIAVSVGREVHDRRTKGLFSVKDLTFDALGAAAAFLLIRHTQR
jgi:putative lipoprotein